ncbi:carbohydrate-binding domain-containing protein [Cellulomonas sp. P22]|uniref:carbohydrate-binding domain-containing protein n=1 Tax=Cellulomonas sp. P22 TaxID=3373189 RepID=UPI00378B3E48
MRRSTLTYLAPAAVLAAVLAGCSSADDSGTSTTGEGTSSAVAAADADITVEEALAANTQPHATEAGWDESDEVAITLTGSGASLDGDGVEVDGSTVTITAPGTYRVTGTLGDGQVVVDSAADGVVRVVLDGADISSSTTSPLQIMDADEAVVVLADGSTNHLSDAATYVYPDAETDEPNAALYSTADLTITGTGSLDVEGNANDGITGKDGLVIDSGTITVTAVDDGIRGKDYLVVTGGTIDVDAGGDALKSDNADDAALGYVYLADGDVDVTSGDDGVAAATDVLVADGTLTVVAGGGSTATLAADASPKGLVGDVSVVIGGGQVMVDSPDDTVHSNGVVSVHGGDLTLAAGDDGIHADNALQISDGTVEVTRSYEGLEAAAITLAGGDVSVVASDDGINAAESTDDAAEDQGGDGPAPGGDPGQGGGEVGTATLTITGGTIVVDADGDGLDVNGSLTMSGGTVVVSGPTNNGNASLDYDGTFDISGGELVAVGASGMAQTPSASSSQSFVGLTFNQTQPAGTVVHVLDADGDAIATFESTKAFSSVVYSSADVVAGDTYRAAVGGSVTEPGTGPLAASGDPSGATVAATGTAGEVTPGMGGGGPMGGGGRPGR